MAWEDRDYYRNREQWGEYLGNPGLALGFSIPIARVAGISIRFSFWLLLWIVFMYMEALKGIRFIDTTAAAILLVASLICHEFGHRFFAQRVGGSHNEFLLWSAGGLNPAKAPAKITARIATYGGGMLVNFVVAALCACFLLLQQPRRLSLDVGLLNPMVGFFARTIVFYGTATSLSSALATLFFINWFMILVNVFPFYCFDGAYLLDAFLSPWLGRFKAINATCITGMVVAVPMFLLSVYSESLLGMVIWALLFAGSFVKRRELKAAGAPSEEDGFGFDWSPAADESSIRRKPRWPSRSAVKKAAQERLDQERIDAILAKVHAQGMQSLSWGEKRALRKATARQRTR
jgi:Zn-dependent protease